MSLLLIGAALVIVAVVVALLVRRAPVQDELQAALEEATRYHKRAVRIVARANRKNRPLTPSELARYDALLAQHAMAMRGYDRLVWKRKRQQQRREERAS